MSFWDTAFAHWLVVGLMAWSFFLVLHWLAPYAPGMFGTVMAAA